MTAAASIRRSLAPLAVREGSRALSSAWTLLAIVTLLMMAANAAWVATGGRLYVVSTASMSPATPVGSLVLVRPAAAVSVGDVISFHPYGNQDVTYTHRVVSVADGPTYLTRGDQSTNDDPWTLHPSDVIGTAVAVLPGVGWLVRAFPWLLVGSILSLLLLGMVEHHRRRAYGVMAAVVLVCVPILLWHPLVRGDLVGTATPAPNELRVKIVNTGLLPVDFSIPKGDQADAPAGEAVQLTGPVDSRGSLWIDALVLLPWWGWALVILICAAPLLATLLLPMGDERSGGASHEAEADASRGTVAPEAPLASALRKEPQRPEPDSAGSLASGASERWAFYVPPRSAGAMGRMSMEGASGGLAM